MESTHEETITDQTEHEQKKGKKRPALDQLGPECSKVLVSKTLNNINTCNKRNNEILEIKINKNIPNLLLTHNINYRKR